MADGLQVMHIQCVQVLSPPGTASRHSCCLQIKLGELASQVDERYGDGLGLPLQAECGAQTG